MFLQVSLLILVPLEILKIHAHNKNVKVFKYKRYIKNIIKLKYLKYIQQSQSEDLG